jgi:hypothetical protein
MNINKIKKQLINDAHHGSNTYWDFAKQWDKPRSIEWNLNSELWVACTGMCKCGNLKLKTANSFERALAYFSDEEIKRYYKEEKI